MIPSVVQQLLGALDGHGALLREVGSDLQARLDGVRLGIQDLAHEALRERFLRGEPPRGHAHVFDPGGGANDLGQASQRADVSGNADVNFLDGQVGVGGAETNVCGTRNVDGQTKSDTVHADDDSC